MNRTRALSLFPSLAVVTGWLLPAGAVAQEYQVDLERSRSVRFVSDAPIEDFEGVTDRIDGYVVLQEGTLGGEDTSGGGELYFEVDLASLDTGIGLRNRHMRENYLETERFPFASYSAEIERVRRDPQRGWVVTASGTFRVHGVDRPTRVRCPVSPTGRGYRVTCEFQVSLPEHDIEIPSLMFMKISEVVELKVDFYVSPVAGEMTATGDTMTNERTT
jgi:polyisoprenoid-binding protein YceI